VNQTIVYNQTTDSAIRTSAPVNSTAQNITGASSIAFQCAATVSTPGAKVFESTAVDVDADTITITSHGYLTGLKGQVSTDGELPAGLSGGTDYFVIKVDANTIKLATSLVNAQAGTAVNITTQGTGDHTFTPTALAGGTATLQKSIDGTNWFTEVSAQNITTTTVLYFEKVDPTALYYRIAYVLTAGELTLTTSMLGKGMS